MPTDMKIRPVILSGGSGTRLWPISRTKLPKQFAAILSEESLFTAALKSAADPALFAPAAVVGNAAHKYLIADAVAASKALTADVILEPLGRNTAAAALIAALLETDADVLHLTEPSDHMITDRRAWHKALAQAKPAAEAGSIVLFGIKPDHPETGYGYIVRGEDLGFENVSRIASFKEKPDAEGAAKLISSGALWNSGIFLYSPHVLLDEAEKLAPELMKTLRQVKDTAARDGRVVTLDKTLYATLPSEPFDRAIMEHTAKGAVVPCSMGWSDVGSWQAMWQISEKDKDGNASIGSVITVDTTNSYIRTEGPTVAVLGMENVTVIAEKDAVMIAPREKTQDVKKLVAAVEQSKPSLAADHVRCRRPWGSYESLVVGPRYQVKRITVMPGGSLSLQMHHHRAEHWIVVEGTAKVQCGETEKIVNPNESVYIPKGEKHRLSNSGTVDLQLIEVQSGDYLGEDDIVRFEDVYGRKSENG